MDYFEIDRIIEELARSFAAPCTSTWFKTIGKHNPSVKEYREKVIEFMNKFKLVIFEGYPTNTDSLQFTDYAKEGLEKAVREAKNGNNKEVERRFRYLT
ncbi:MAG: hypothetical protein M3162_04935 [Thermoproteota archaeon]|nr:hypothetical protein [Thermoproteota archaeon]